MGRGDEDANPGGSEFLHARDEHVLRRREIFTRSNAAVRPGRLTTENWPVDVLRRQLANSMRAVWRK